MIANAALCSNAWLAVFDFYLSYFAGDEKPIPATSQRAKAPPYRAEEMNTTS